jgi:lysophospholipid acyltransferase (LPLAT)-like uncharacterized protein
LNPAQATTTPKSQIVVPHRPKWHGQIAAWLIYALGSTFSSTWRLKWHDESGLFDGKQQGPLIFSIWHNRLAFSMTFWKYGREGRKAAGLAALISASKDGALLARTLEHFHVQAARGSSSRRGSQALLELTSYIEEGFHVAITPDGPRGPKYQIQEGIISLAQLTAAPIVPVGAIARRKYSLKSWDSFQIPLPFTRCDLYFARPICVPRNASMEERLRIAEELRSVMLKLNPDE